ncbi:hypothetical protein [Streptomyces fulvoviolaceus]|uniref:hypothetical protein n=1 Tax=Streptomyces fulvoviolaceus TaxID=285535 RepID=UPI000AD2A1C1|nr:hypothetical protein [Streptomyces fulvoviolaceus]
MDALWSATRLAPYWRAAGALSEGRYWIDAALDRTPPDRPERAWALLMTGAMGVWSGDLETALERFPQAVEVARRTGEGYVVTLAEAYLGALTALGGAVDEGLAAFEEARVRIIASGDLKGIGTVHYEGALLRAVLGDTGGAPAVRGGPRLPGGHGRPPAVRRHAHRPGRGPRARRSRRWRGRRQVSP